MLRRHSLSPKKILTYAVQLVVSIASRLGVPALVMVRHEVIMPSAAACEFSVAT